MKKKIITILFSIILLIFTTNNIFALDLKYNTSENLVFKDFQSISIFVDDDADASWYNHTNVRTIQEGINNATENSTIFVYNGTYFENIIINKQIKVIGENKTNTIIDGNLKNDVIKINSDFITLSNLHVKNSGTNTGSAININSKNNTIKNISISSDSILQNNMGFYLNLDGDFNKISNCKVYNSNIGFKLHSSYNEISNCILRDCGVQGIVLYTNAEDIDKICSNNKILNNTLYEKEDLIGWGYGIWLHRSINNLIEGNFVKEKYFGLDLEENSDKNTILKNNFSQNSGYGIGISSSSNCNISYNKIYENNLFGIGFQNSPNKNNIVYHNNIINNKINTLSKDCNNLSWVENYYDDWVGLKFKLLGFLPYIVPKGLGFIEKIKIPRLSKCNYDFNPSFIPYDL